MSEHHLRGVIFDWDGVLIDSSKHHEESWERLARETGHTLPPDHFKKGFGMKNEIIIPHQLGWTQDPVEVNRLSLRKEALYREVVVEWGIALLPGVETLLAALRSAGIPYAIGSSTQRLNITTTLERLGFADLFPHIISAENVAHGKPDPEVFLKAAEALGLPPESCLVFEDALVGIEAAHRAGMKVVAVATTNPPDLLTHADLSVYRLTEITLPMLQTLLAPSTNPVGR